MNNTWLKNREMPSDLFKKAYPDLDDKTAMCLLIDIIRTAAFSEAIENNDKYELLVDDDDVEKGLHSKNYLLWLLDKIYDGNCERVENSIEAIQEDDEYFSYPSVQALIKILE